MTNYLLRAGQLSMIRAAVLRALPGTAIIQDVTITNTKGVVSETWAAVANGTVACRLDPMQLQGAELAGAAETLQFDYRLILPYDAPITTTSRVVIDSTTYEVRSLTNANTWLAFKQAHVARVT